MRPWLPLLLLAATASAWASGNPPRTLVYKLSGSDKPEQGTVSSDGRSASVRTWSQSGTIKGPRLLGVSETHDGALQVVLEDDELAAVSGYGLEVSTNLREWSRVGDFVMEGTTGFSRDETPVDPAPRFYRARRLP